jgi:hypothetical protein
MPEKMRERFVGPDWKSKVKPGDMGLPVNGSNLLKGKNLLTGGPGRKFCAAVMIPPTRNDVEPLNG